MRHALLDGAFSPDRRGTRHRPDGAARWSTSSSRTSATRPACWCWRAWWARTSSPATRHDGPAPGPAARGRARRRRPGLGRGVPDRRDPAATRRTRRTRGAWTPASRSCEDLAEQRRGRRASPSHGCASRSARLLSGTSMLLLPLIARGHHARLLRLHRRYQGYRRFDAYDTEIGMEFASRAAIFIDNARRYSRERATALTLQRSLLPTGLSAPSSVEVRHRYLPGSKMIEVGGDWYESIALPGGRVALVVGDVAGHGVRAAVTMGRLRTAIRTLATARAAARGNAAAARRAHARARASASRTSPPACTRSSTRSPAAARSPRPATCRRCWCRRTAAASSWTSRRPRRSASGRGPIQTRTFKIEDGSLLVLYTDGLVETRHGDIDDGLDPAARDVRPRLDRAARWRTCARPRWPACTPTSSATTSRC